MFIGFVIFMLKLYLDIIIGRQLDRLMPFWQPANILHSLLIFMLLWQINIAVVVDIDALLAQVLCSCKVLLSIIQTIRLGFSS